MTFYRIAVCTPPRAWAIGIDIHGRPARFTSKPAAATVYANRGAAETDAQRLADWLSIGAGENTRAAAKTVRIFPATGGTCTGWRPRRETATAGK